MSARPQSGREKRVCVAQIGAAHGLKGELRLWSFTADPLAVKNYGPLESEDGKRHFTIKELRAAKDHFVVRLAGVDDRNAAEALRNVKLYIARDKLPATEDNDTFYHADLVGLSVMTKTGEKLGEVTAVHNFGAGDILDIELNDHSTVMLPFTEHAVPEVDIKKGIVVVDPPTEIPGEDDPAAKAGDGE